MQRITKDDESMFFRMSICLSSYILLRQSFDGQTSFLKFVSDLSVTLKKGKLRENQLREDFFRLKKIAANITKYWQFY